MSIKFRRQPSDLASSEPTNDLEQRACEMLERRFLAEAAEPDVEARLDGDLDAKLGRLGGKQGKTVQTVRALAEQAAALWARRSDLRAPHVLYLAAAVLYFIAPLDVLPDVIPGLGYADDVIVLSSTIGMILKALPNLKALPAANTLTRAKNDLIEDLLEKGKVKLNEVIDEREDELFQRLDRAATDSVRKTVTSIAVSLWATTTAASVSVAVTTLSGTWPPMWLTYVVVSSAIVFVWNVVTAVSFLREFRQLDGRWQDRLPELILARLSARHALALGVPVLILVGLGVARVLLRT